MKRLFRGALALLLCLSMGFSSGAIASAEETGVLDAGEMQALLDEYIASHKLNADKISLGYLYTETGDVFYYNEDTWYYSASTYKVPVMMLLAEQEYRGEITRDTKLKGLTLGYAEEAILTYSNNDYAHLMMSVLAPSEPECRDMYKQFASLPDDYYISDFRDYSYFTTRFLTEVMQTLYTEPERFPNIIDCLLAANPDHYFRMQLPGYKIAQKYGSYMDYMGRDFNHTTGIIYLPHPIILTVMTQDCPASETVISDLARIFVNYTEKVDERLADYQARLESERLAAEEAERQEAARIAAEEAARLAAEESPAPEEEAGFSGTIEPLAVAEQEELAPEADAAQLGTRLYVLIAAGIVLGINLLVVAFRRGKERIS